MTIIDCLLLSLNMAGGVDYDSVAGDTITISASSTSVTVNIMTDTDMLLEGEETFRVTLTTTDGSVDLLTPSALVSLSDATGEFEGLYSSSVVYSHPPPTLHILSSVARVEFSSLDYMVVEGGTLTARVRVRPTGITVATDVTVNVETVPGSATGTTYVITVGSHFISGLTAGDYTSVNVPLTIMAGGSRSVTVDIVTSSDDVVEGLEMFSLSLSHGEGLVSVPTPTADISLIDNTSEFRGYN